MILVRQIVYDDYNSRIRADQQTMATLTSNCGSPTPRNGVKIIEIWRVGGVSTCIKTPSGGGNQPHIVGRCNG